MQTESRLRTGRFVVAAAVMMLALWAPGMARRAEAQTPFVTLDGGVFITNCLGSVCETDRWYCINGTDLTVHVTNAAPDSVVTMKKTQLGGSALFQADVGITDGDGSFNFTTTVQPPNNTGFFSMVVVVNGEESDLNNPESRYFVGRGHPPCP